MTLNGNIKNLFIAVCSLVIVGTSTISASAERTDRVHNTMVSNLRVRKNPSVNAPILYTLAKGKDLVYEERVSKHVTENGVSRVWNNYAYPDANQGKYTKSKLGWICSHDGSNGKYIENATRTTFYKDQWIYNDKAMTKKHKVIKPGTYIMDHQQGLRHDMSDLNLWRLRTHDDNAKPGDSPKMRYFGGWMANAAGDSRAKLEERE